MLKKVKDRKGQKTMSDERRTAIVMIPVTKDDMRATWTLPHDFDPESATYTFETYNDGSCELQPIIGERPDGSKYMTFEKRAGGGGDAHLNFGTGGGGVGGTILTHSTNHGYGGANLDGVAGVGEAGGSGGCAPDDRPSGGDGGRKGEPGKPSR